ncbi:MAG: hypothetical protein K2X01_00725 [Cyanobacteria bacterium]|nr:hypothetical protein [Cyanobacteriota bacterium]
MDHPPIDINLMDFDRKTANPPKPGARKRVRYGGVSQLSHRILDIRLLMGQAHQSNFLD